MNVNATSFLTGGLVDICFWIPLQIKQPRKTAKVIIQSNIIFLTKISSCKQFPKIALNLVFGTNILEKTQRIETTY